MSDLLNAPRSALDVLLLGIKITHELMDYYKAVREQDAEIAKTTKKLSDLLSLLSELRLQIEQHRQRKNRGNILATIESSTKDCEEIIEELKEELTKFRRMPQHSTRTKLLTTIRRGAYPIRRSTLQKLDEDINEILRRLSFGTNIVLHSDVAGLQNAMDDVKALLQSMGAAQVSSDIRHWLEAPDAMINFNEAADKRHRNTGLWFVESQEFENWKQNDFSLLWLVGFAGCGKSILCSTAIQHTIQQRTSRGAALAFFFFTFNDDRKQSASSMLRTLILQLSGQLSQGNAILSKLQKSCHSMAPSNQALKDCLRHILRQFQATFIFLDGLDESPRDKHRGDVLQALAELRSWSEPSLHIMVSSRDEVDIRDSLRDCSTEIIRMRNSSIDSDIAAFISENLRSNSRLRKWEQHSNRISTVLTKGAQGMFRWAECQLDAVARCPRSEDHLESVLRSLPQTLDETYERMLQRISVESKGEARRMLTILCCARRPLVVNELLEGMAVELGESPRFNPKRKLMDMDAIHEICPGFIEFYRNDGAEETCVRIAHFSVQEYLESDRICTRQDVAFYGAKKRLAHADMVCICLTILLEPDLLQDERKIEDSPIKTPTPKVAMANYAACYWPTHYHDCQKNTLVVNQASRLLADRNPQVKAWVALHDVNRLTSTPSPLYYASLLGLDAAVRNILASYPDSINMDGKRFYHQFTLRGRYHSRQVQKREQDCPDIDDRGGYYRTALLAASVRGHVHIVQQLLAKGADIYTNDDLYGSAFHAASHHGHRSTLEHLLDKSTEARLQRERGSINPWGTSYSATLLPATIALGFAAWLADSEKSRISLSVYATATLLLACTIGYSLALRGKFIEPLGERNAQSPDQIINIDFKNKDGRTPLSCAAANGHTDVAVFLLEAGADVNALDTHRRTPLSYAAEHAHVAMTKLLLHHGAAASLDSDPRDPGTDLIEIGDTENMTPLHYTVRFAAVNVANLLLESGLSIDVAVRRRRFDESGRITCKHDASHASGGNGIGLTPLHYAAWVGSMKMVAFFLRHGADPNARSQDGETPLQLVVAKTIKGPEYMQYGKYWTEDHWRIEVISSIAIDEGGAEEFSSTHAEITRARMSVLSALLDDGRIRVNDVDDEGESVLHKLQYCRSGKHQFVKKLVQHDAQCTARRQDNKTPLHLACLGGDYKSVRILANSADHLARCDNDGENSLHCACRSGCKKTIKEVIRACRKHNIDLSPTKSLLGKNALHCYVESIFLQKGVVQVLLNYGVEPSERDSTGSSALSLYENLQFKVAEPDIPRLLSFNK